MNYYSEDTEKYILSCIIREEDLDISTIDENDFSNSLYLAIFKAIKKIKQKDGVRVDIFSVRDELQKEIPTITLDELVAINDFAGTTSNYEHFLKKLHNCKYKRLIEKIRQEIPKILIENESDVVSEVQNLFLGIEQKQTEDLKNGEDALKECLEQLNYLAKNKGQISGLRTTFHKVDEYLLGIKATDLVVIGARSAMGKSAYMLEIAKNNAVKHNKRALIFTLEMSTKQCFGRMLCSQGEIPNRAYRTGLFTPEELKRLKAASEELKKNNNLLFYDKGNLTISKIENYAKRIKKKYGNLDMILIDYLQLMKTDGNFQSKHLEIADITRRLKLLAKELEVPIFILSQINRGVEALADKRPHLSDLKESGSIEENADIVMLLYRDEYYNPNTTDRNIAEVIIAKNRDGACGTAKVKYIGEYTKFDNLIGG